MNGMFNNNFVVGMLLARDLPRQDQLLTGLVAGQMPANSALGPILLKPIIDARVASETDKTTAQTEATGLRQALEIELPANTRTVKLSVPGAAAQFSTTGDATVDADGTVHINTTDNTVVSIASAGVVRQVTVKVAAVAAPPGGLAASRRATANAANVSTPSAAPGNANPASP